MSMTDPIADMLTRIRNATQAGHRRVVIPASNQKRAMAQLLKEQGYIEKFEVFEEDAQGTLRLFLKYYAREGRSVGVIEGIRRVSRPGRRIFADKENIPKVDLPSVDFEGFTDNLKKGAGKLDEFINARVAVNADKTKPNVPIPERVVFGATAIKQAIAHLEMVVDAIKKAP